MVFGGEHGEKGDYVGVGNFLQVFEFADGVWGHAFGVLFLDFYLLDSNEFGWICAEVTEVDICIGSFTELLPCEILDGGSRGNEGCGPLTYLCFSSSFICSARSWSALLLLGISEGVPFVLGLAVEIFDLLAAAPRSTELVWVTRGERAILGSKVVGKPFDILGMKYHEEQLVIFVLKRDRNVKWPPNKSLNGMSDVSEA